jgi:hypothetical protein
VKIEVHSTPSGISNWVSVYESPPVNDIEGDRIYIKLEMKVANIKLVSNGDSFELFYDQGKLVNPPTTLTVVLKNEGSMFPNRYYINLQTTVVNTNVPDEKIFGEQAPS